MNYPYGKHILFISRWYPSATDPMLGLFVKNHARAAISGGYRVSVAYISPITSEKLSDPSKRFEIKEDGFLSEHIVYYHQGGIFSPFNQFIAWYKAVMSVIRKNGIPDIIHAHILTRVGLVAYIISKIYKVPYVITEHWSRYYSDNASYKGYIRKFITKIVVKNASETTAVSERLYNAMTANNINFQKKILPNAVDTGLFAISSKKNPVFRFVSITCFEDKSKNLKLLLRAASRLTREGETFELLMIGDGADFSLIQNYARELEINVVFTGTLEPSETAEMLSHSHCLVLSSNYETFAIVVYEALSCGVPVIATDVADLKLVINNKSGIIIPTHDEDALYTSMKEMMANHHKYNPEYLRKIAIDNSSFETVTRKLSEIYQKTYR